VVPEDISHRTGGGGKTKALRKTGHAEGLNNSEAGAFLRKDLGLGHRNTYLLPWSGAVNKKGVGSIRDPSLSLFTRLPTRSVLGVRFLKRSGILEKDALKEKSSSPSEANPKEDSSSHSGGEDVTGDYRPGLGGLFRSPRRPTRSSGPFYQA
jgi:hypothetical protein